METVVLSGGAVAGFARVSRVHEYYIGRPRPHALLTASKWRVTSVVCLLPIAASFLFLLFLLRFVHS